MLGIVERDSGDTRWLHNGDRADGHQLTSLTIAGSTWPISHDDAGRVTEGANTDYEYGPRGKLLRATRGALHQQGGAAGAFNALDNAYNPFSRFFNSVDALGASRRKGTAGEQGQASARTVLEFGGLLGAAAGGRGLSPRDP